MGDGDGVDRPLSKYRCPDGKYRGCDFLGCDQWTAARLRGELPQRCEKGRIVTPADVVPFVGRVVIAHTVEGVVRAGLIVRQLDVPKHGQATVTFTNAVGGDDLAPIAVHRLERLELAE